MILLGRFFCILAIVVLSGLDQAVVQTYAWATMIHDRSSELGLANAIDDTFSGENPCEICCALAEVTEEEEKESPADQSADKLPKLFTNSSPLRLFPPVLEKWPHLEDAVFPRSIKLEIPTPPPEFG